MGRFFVEDCAEELGASAEEFFVEDPMSILLADIDVYHGAGEKFIEWFLFSFGHFGGWRRAKKELRAEYVVLTFENNEIE